MIKNIFKVFYAFCLFFLFTIIFIIGLIFVIFEKDTVSIFICGISFIFAFVIPTILVISGLTDRILFDNNGIHIYKNKHEIDYILWESILNIQFFSRKLSVIEIEYNQNGIDRSIRIDYTNKIIDCIKKYIPDDLKIKYDFLIR